MAALLELAGITKRYPGVVANHDVSLEVAEGEIQALLGENGAGKSTLMKIVYGLVRQDEGEIRWKGQAVTENSPVLARHRGIGMVFQHFTLFETLTVAENVALGLDPQAAGPDLPARIRDLATRYGLAVDPMAPVWSLSVGERQRVEIVRCLLQSPRLLIMDEPTSVLTPQEADGLFATLRRLASEGCAVLYISHKLEEIRSLCHAATVLRGGKVVARCDPTRETARSLAALMIGKAPPELAHRPSRSDGPVVLKVRDLSLRPSDPHGTNLRRIGFEIHAGEIVGVAGVAGNGQRELLRALSGEDPRAPQAAIELAGQPVGDLNPRRRRDLGLSFVPEERLGRGAAPKLSLALNALLTGNRHKLTRAGLIDAKAIDRRAAEIIRHFGVRAAGTHAEAASLSGGNLQKFIVGRELYEDPKLLIAAHPTWGVDVGAATMIREEMLALRDRGGAVLLFSEELEELFLLADRIAVMFHGMLSPPTPIRELTPESVGLLMGGAGFDEGDAGRAQAH
ncbi:MAG TPA: ABC transporter ATP-binding protein [Geminicoccus sp.]|jgi:simple sugar transport system ATP-binding protein|uniref:ABC transporter ATP-binding protein n=1 Tax=Geminicoccus sp. TaxID=2024832 RepID=UPI002E363708|nr:ABC transporter ATP-binding protein [Geminicoccus sp.]HEX2525648.1 ABC transporter ATP-binding protein [Geminicoccus sp.]